MFMALMKMKAIFQVFCWGISVHVILVTSFFGRMLTYNSSDDVILTKKKLLKKCLAVKTSHITNLFGFLLKFWTVFDFITDQSTKEQIRKWSRLFCELLVRISVSDNGHKPFPHSQSRQKVTNQMPEFDKNRSKTKTKMSSKPQSLKWKPKHLSNILYKLWLKKK